MMELINSLIDAAGSVLVGLITFIGVVITNTKSNRDIEHKLETAQAVTDIKIDELTREVREHNSFAKRIPVVENDIQTIYHRLNVAEHNSH